VGNLKRLILIALAVPLLIAVVVRDPVGMWHFVAAAVTFGVKLVTAVVVFLANLITGKSR
jgi:hypothetical protein